MRAWISLLIVAAIAAPAAAEPAINKKHRLLEHDGGNGAVSIATHVDSVAFNDLDGQTHRVGQEGTTAFVFLSTSCPLAKRYTQRLNRMHEEFAENGMSVYGVFSNSEDDRDEVVAHVEAMKFAFPVVKDVHGYLATRLGAAMTPQAIVVDQDGAIRYRGAIDDNRYENRVKENYLHDVLVAIRDGLPISEAKTRSFGCTIHLPTSSDVGEVTYTQHVARILQDNCQSCHRAGQVAPFSIANYEEASTWATEIDAYAQARLMPPWKPAPDFGEFLHPRRLSDEQLALINRWAEGGAPEGPLEDLPPSPEFDDEWSIGEPDFVVEMPEEYTIAAEGEDDYRHFIVPTDFDRDMFVRAADVMPGNRQTVHHVLVYTDTSGKARELDAADPGPGYTRFGDVGFEPASGLGGWAPGSTPTPAPPGTGRWIPKGADVILQVHYYRTGVDEKDRTKVGLYFSDDPQPAPVQVGMAINHKFEIPPGDSRYRVDASVEVEEPVYAISVAPHMHLLGTEMKVTATLPDGRVVPLVWIKDWDFNWQDSYRFEEPILFPRGTKVELVAYFDNSNDNPNNPHDPPQPVGWGEKTTDEMCIAFFSYLKADQWQPKQEIEGDSTLQVSKVSLP